MVERVELISTPESGPNPPETTTSTPDHNLPPETPSDLAKSYAELRAEYTRKSQELAELKRKHEGGAPAQTEDDAAHEAALDAVTQSDREGNEGQGNEDAAQKVADAAGFDLNPFNEEYERSGDVSEESREKIAEGLKSVLGEDARTIVDQFIESQKVVHQNDRRLAYEEAGGEEQYRDMVMWAKDNLSADEIRAYNATVNSHDRHSSLLAIRGLRSKYESANGRIPNNVTAAGTTPSGSVKPFTSAAEMVRAMSDPLYQSDPAYRESVKARIAASPDL